ncbi:ArsR/SmtB family transcription factor [Bacillus cereus]|uniref:ArsR/SmtB family transcription factor n=1 Tax=Bacillus cereus TaxID=1396 RepID=UPI000BF9B873|nr:metalloregulator ArsR/SmtB family transcription factor [Bacillus cereus]PER82270.1 transcriptional regulator [Bacillus cereus]
MTIITNQEIEYMDFEEKVEVLKILGHPTRLKILNELYKHKVLNVTQLTQILKLPQSTVSQNLGKMKGKILKGDRQGLEMYYSINNTRIEKIITL